MQLLLIRHALPLRSTAAEGSDPGLSEAGFEQARRLPQALKHAEYDRDLGSLGTARLLSFPIDYASVTRLLYSRAGRASVVAVNGTEHVWDLLPRNQR